MKQRNAGRPRCTNSHGWAEQNRNGHVNLGRKKVKGSTGTLSVQPRIQHAFDFLINFLTLSETEERWRTIIARFTSASTHSCRSLQVAEQAALHIHGPKACSLTNHPRPGRKRGHAPKSSELTATVLTSAPEIPQSCCAFLHFNREQHEQNISGRKDATQTGGSSHDHDKLKESS